MKPNIAYWLKGEAVQNFGDALSIVLFKKLFYPLGVRGAAFRLIGSVVDDMFVPRAVDPESVPPVVFWGCGIREPGGLSPEAARRSRILTVRGPITASELKLGATVPTGDPALLLPAIYAPTEVAEVKGRSICIPHFHDRRPDDELLQLSRCDAVLRPQIGGSERDVLAFIDALTSAEFILSASLHGAIVAAAYGKPFAFWNPGEIDLPLKWSDFALSVGIPPEFSANIAEGRSYYEASAKPKLAVPSLWGLLTHAPFLLRPTALLKVLRHDLREAKEKTLAVIDQRIKAFEDQDDHFEAILHDVEAAYRSLESQVERLAAEAQTRENQLRKKSGELVEQQALLAEHAAAKLEKEKLQFANELLRDQASILHDRIAAVDAESKRLRSDNSSLQARLEIVENKREALELALEEKRARIEVIESKKEALEIAQEERRARLDKIQTDLDRAVARSDLAAHKIEIADRQIEILTSENAILKERLAELRKSMDGLETQLQRSDAEVLRNSELLADEQRAVQILEDERERDRARFMQIEDSLSADREQALSRAEHLYRELNTATATATALKQSRESMRREVVKRWKIKGNLPRIAQAVAATGLFDRQWYLERHTDVAKAGMDPLRHYLEYGILEGRNPNPYFDTAWYLVENPDVLAAAAEPLVHYAQHGWKEGRNPSERFDTKAYLEAHPGVKDAGENPLLHFLRAKSAGGAVSAPPVVAPDPLPVVPAEIGVHAVQPAAPAVAKPHRSHLRDERKPVVVMIDSVYPRPDQDSGSIDAINYIRIFQDLGYLVVFVADAEFAQGSLTYRTELAARGVRIVSAPEFESPEAFIEAEGAYVDVFFLSRVYCGGRLFERVAYHSDAKIVFNTVDLHFVREEREAKVRDDATALRRAGETKERELYLARLADLTLVVSDFEQKLLEAEVPGARVVTMPLMRDCPGSGAPFEARSGVGFIGGFDHAPNVDAVNYFLSDIWPLVHAELPDAKFFIMGSNMPAAFENLNVPGVIPIGYVADLSAELKKVRVMVAPLRFGAGAKGKVITSLAHGVPCVGTAMATEGMTLTNGENIFIAASADEFAARVVEVHESAEIWERLSAGGTEVVLRNYSYAAGSQRIRDGLAEIGAPTRAALVA